MTITSALLIMTQCLQKSVSSETYHVVEVDDHSPLSTIAQRGPLVAHRGILRCRTHCVAIGGKADAALVASSAGFIGTRPSLIAYIEPFREEWPSPGGRPSWAAVRSDRCPSKP